MDWGGVIAAVAGGIFVGILLGTIFFVVEDKLILSEELEVGLDEATKNLAQIQVVELKGNKSAKSDIIVQDWFLAWEKENWVFIEDSSASFLEFLNMDIENNIIFYINIFFLFSSLIFFIIFFFKNFKNLILDVIYIKYYFLILTSSISILFKNLNNFYMLKSSLNSHIVIILLFSFISFLIILIVF